jgi:hypothetical protein
MSGSTPRGRLCQICQLQCVKLSDGTRRKVQNSKCALFRAGEASWLRSLIDRRFRDQMLGFCI